MTDREQIRLDLVEAAKDLQDAVDAVCSGDAFGDANIPDHARSVLELSLGRFREALADFEQEQNP